MKDNVFEVTIWHRKEMIAPLMVIFPNVMETKQQLDILTKIASNYCMFRNLNFKTRPALAKTMLALNVELDPSDDVVEFQEWVGTSDTRNFNIAKTSSVHANRNPIMSIKKASSFIYSRSVLDRTPYVDLEIDGDGSLVVVGAKLFKTIRLSQFIVHELIPGKDLDQYDISYLNEIKEDMWRKGLTEDDVSDLMISFSDKPYPPVFVDVKNDLDLLEDLVICKFCKDNANSKPYYVSKQVSSKIDINKGQLISKRSKEIWYLHRNVVSYEK